MVTVSYTSGRTMLNKYANFYPKKPRDLIVMIFYKLTTTVRSDAQQSRVYQKNYYACQWLDNVDMHTYAEFDKKKYTMWHMHAQFDQNMPCGGGATPSFLHTSGWAMLE